MALHFLLALLLLPIQNTAQGLVFSGLSWKESMEQARRSEKNLFVDAYTSWCAPCKMLQEFTFPDSALGAYFNAHFINLKVDLEQGEGPSLNQEWVINAYPTLLFFDTSGREVHRAVGFFSANELLEIGEQANHPEHQLVNFKQAFLEGHCPADRLPSLLRTLERSADPLAARVAHFYLLQQENYHPLEVQKWILTYADDPEQPAFQYLLKKRTDFYRRFGKDRVDARIQVVIHQYLQLNPTLPPAQVKRLKKSLKA
jgi:thiol-disulfide isomerase/thioredoxin